jgi:hypothetical protein
VVPARLFLQQTEWIWPVTYVESTLPRVTMRPCALQPLHADHFFYEGPSYHSLKAFCATPMKMMRMSSFFYQFLQLVEHQWNEIDRRKPKTRRKTCPSATLPTTNLTWTWPGTEPRASVVRGRRLTAWAMARPRRPVNLIADLNLIFEM